MVRLDGMHFFPFFFMCPSHLVSTSLSYTYTHSLSGTVKTMLGKFGNSDPLNFEDWIELDSESLATFSEATLYNSQDRQCENMVTSVNMDIMYANVGEEGNPQPKIMTARLWFDSDTWRFRGTSSINATQNFAFYSTVNFVNYDSETTGVIVPPTPELLPTLPHDLWYPFTLSAGTRKSPSWIMLLLLPCVLSWMAMVV